jgi:hypothetical protein
MKRGRDDRKEKSKGGMLVFFANFEHDFHYAQAMKSIFIYKG